MTSPSIIAKAFFLLAEDAMVYCDAFMNILDNPETVRVVRGVVKKRIPTSIVILDNDTWNMM